MSRPSPARPSPRTRRLLATLGVVLGVGVAFVWSASGADEQPSGDGPRGASAAPAGSVADALTDAGSPGTDPASAEAAAPVAGARRPLDLDAHPCLARPNRLVVEGPQQRFPERTPLSPGLTIDARTAGWSVGATQQGAQRYPFVVRSDAADLCLVGGTLRHERPHETTSWSEWHDVGAAVSVSSPRFRVVGTELDNVGDGFAFSTLAASGWTLEGVHVRRAHDDCVENDTMVSGRILRSFFDGCYVFYSAQGPPGSTRDGSGELVEIRSSLVRMEAMPQVYRPESTPAPGHSVVFKQPAGPRWGLAPRLAIHDTILRVDSIPAAGSVLGHLQFDHDGDAATPPIDHLVDCSGNTLVWTVDAPFPDDLPDCFELTTDTAVWDQAVADWRAATGGSQ